MDGFGVLRKQSERFRIIGILLFLLIPGILWADGNVTTITILNAHQTSYKKDADTGNDTIILDGSVELSVQKGNSTSEIKADRITYDRKTEMLYATGSVEITTKSGSSAGETSTASSLLMNTSTMEGIFDGGKIVQAKSENLNLPSGSVLIVFSDMFGKSESNAIAFKNSQLTFCDEEEPHWHVDSTRTWLLPGGEFAFFNALLYVGKVPVVYLPAFYYPKDELLFNPVFGSTKRRGSFVQTTTYLKGRKPLDNSSSSSSTDSSASAESLKALYNFMKPSTLKEQERQGLILHNLDENFTGSTANYVKLMTDAYSNLGYFVGIDGNLSPNNDYISTLKFNVDLGFSKTLLKKGTGYEIYVPKTTGLSPWDESHFMGLDSHFRYSANLDLSIKKPFSLSITMPVYSDPYYYYDFKSERSENMDWISTFINSAGKDTDKTDTSESSPYSSFTWNLNASYSPTLPQVVKPYISSLSMSYKGSLNATATNYNLSGKDSSGEKIDGIDAHEKYKDNQNWASYTPERQFYYPSSVQPANINVSMSGTLFQWPLPASSAKKTDTKKSKDVKLSVPDELKSLKQLEAEKLEAEKLAAQALKNTEEELETETSTVEKDIQFDKKAEIAEASTSELEENTENLLYDLLKPVFPDVSVSSNLTTLSGLNFKLGYSIAPSFTSQISYSDKKIKNKQSVTYLYRPDDFKWDTINSNNFTFKMPTSVSSNLSYGGSFFSMTNKLSYDPVWQNHPNKNGMLESTKRQTALADAKARTQTVSESNTISLKPFLYVPYISDSSISYSTNFKLFRQVFKTQESSYTGDDYDDHWNWKERDAYESYLIFKDFADDRNGDKKNWNKMRSAYTDEEWEKKTPFEKEVAWRNYQQNFCSTNSLNVTLSAKEAESKFSQNLTFSLTMPPQYRKLNFSLNTVFPYVTNSISWSCSENSTDTNKNRKFDDWTYNDLSQAMSLSLFNSSLKLSESLSFVTDKQEGKDIYLRKNDIETWNNNLEEWNDSHPNAKRKEKKENNPFNYFNNAKVSLSWKKMTAVYTMSYTQGYDLEKDNGGWKAREIKEFLPYSLAFTWSPSSKTYYRWSNKISFSPGLSTSVTADL
ncbi:MAG: hypothetical protein MJ188_10810, partial [Treponema sp.]|nr:hypothetical protein [Treponema sp.]